jgi:alpha-beta hydrolase superfamily lysophospholipase
MTTSSIAEGGRAAPGEDSSAGHDEGLLARRKTSGPALYFEARLPAAGSARAVVGLLHGFAEYGGRYAHVARRWADRGIGVLTVDMRGHGKAQGARGSCRHFGEYLDDVAELFELLRERATSLPAFLFGHSFGGLVATAECLASPSRWRGVILSSPTFGVAVKVPALKRAAGRVASRVLPDFSLPAGVRGSDLTHDQAIARAYDEDPLVFKNARARWFTEMLSAQERVMASAGSFSLPLYVAVGTQDRVADVAMAKAFFQAAASPDKTLDVAEGLFHEVLNEPQWPELADRMGDWILKRS